MDFTADEKSLIKTVPQRNIVNVLDKDVSGVSGSASHTWNSAIISVVQNFSTTAYYNTISDKIFLPDVKQLNAIYNHRDVLGDTYYMGYLNSTAIYSWVRTPVGGKDGNDLRMVSTDGTIASGRAFTTSPKIYVRPMFYLDSNSMYLKSGAGSDADPYKLTSIPLTQVTSIKKNYTTVTVNTYVAETGAKLYLGVYSSDNELKSVKSYLLVNGINSTNADITEYNSKSYVKAFVWKEGGSMMPLSGSEKLSLKEFITDSQYYPGWLRKAVTFSYDDGRTEDAQFIGILNSAGLKGTFNFFQNNYTYYSRQTTGYSDLLSIYEGHEIANHSKTHPRMYLDGLPDGYTPLTVEQCITDISEGKAWLDSMTCKDTKGFVWPYKDPQRQELYDYLRSDISGVKYVRPVTTKYGTDAEFDPPEDFYNWEFSTHHKFIATEGPKFLNLSDDGKLKLFAVWGHAYEFASTTNSTTGVVTPATWYLIQNFADSVKDRTDIWKATNIEVCEYITALRNAEITSTYIKNSSDVDLYVKIDGWKQL